MDNMIYIERKEGIAEEFIELMLNDNTLHNDIKKVNDNEFLIDVTRLKDIINKFNPRDNIVDFLNMMLSERYTCAQCGCHTNCHGYTYRENGGCIGKTPGCMVCNGLSDVEYYRMLDNNTTYKEILEGRGIIGKNKELINSFNALKEYCYDLFYTLYNASAQHIDNLELSLNNSTKEVSRFINEIQKAISTKYGSALSYIDLIADINSERVDITFNFDFDRYILPNNASAKEIIDEVFCVAGKMCCLDKCA